MGGFKAVTGQGTTMYADNVDFTGNAIAAPQITLDGQLLIGSTATPNIKVATLTAGMGVTIANASGSITISATGGGLTWQTITASQGLSVNNGYICISPGGAISLSLPAVSAVGNAMSITLDGATSFTITQGVGQQIRIGNQQTTSGAGGSVASTAQGDTVTMICSVANTRWNIVSSMGNITVV